MDAIGWKHIHITMELRAVLAIIRGMAAIIYNKVFIPEAGVYIVAWIRENGYECDGAPYDIYVKTGFDSLPVRGWVTEVYFPVKKTEA